MLPYKCILVTGATSGIGRALTHRLIQTGAFVIAVGRRQDRLDQLATQYGDKISTESFDVSDITKLPEWCQSITSKYPIDAAILNAGFQQQLNLLEPSSISLDAITSELHCNYLSPVHMTMLLLPHLQSIARSNPAALIYVTSGLALVPSCSSLTYSASKAALHSFVWGVRAQVETEYPNLKVVEIVPPAVKTELHTSQGLAAMGVDLEQYVDNVWTELLQGNDDIRCQITLLGALKADDERKVAFDRFTQAIRAKSTT